MDFNKIVLLKGTFGYYNRKIYFYEALADYLSLASDYETETDINFNPNDGVEASLIIGSAKNIDYFDFCYLLVLNKNDEIVSRWYIMDANRNLSGQFTLTLRRDVVAESIGKTDFIAGAPVYVEKGKLPDTDPMIVNSEGMSFNQIKKSEMLLKDPAGWAYIVGYIKTGATASVTFSSGVNFVPDEYFTQIQIANDTKIDVADLGDMFSGIEKPFAVSALSLVYGVRFYNPSNQLSSIRKQQIIMPNTGISGGLLNNSYINLNEFAWSWSHNIGQIIASSPYQLNSIANSINSNSLAALKTAIQNVIRNDVPSESFYTKESIDALMSYEGKVLYYSGAYYRMHIQAVSSRVAHAEVVISKGENALFDTAIAAAFVGTSTQSNDWELYLNFETISYSIQLTPYDLTSYKLNLPNSVNSLRDAPYTMFVIPYCDNMALIGNGNITFDDDMLNKEKALACVNALAETLGQANVIDVQLLPYMPDFQDWICYYGTSETPYLWRVNVRNKTKNEDFIEIMTNGNDVVGAILFPRYSNFSFTLDYYLNHEDEMKVESQCNFYRLCSPNYNGLFEFNLAKNGGVSTYFEVDCTYKPFNPFIRITPQFSSLYGMNYKDGRGLICGGDYSLPYLSSAWADYENNNKNFANIFARDIQNLDVSQRQERFKEPFELGAGVLTAGIGGAVAGSKGGAAGAIAGAVVGTAAGGAGAYLDSMLAAERRRETKDYMIDRFNMSLANVKAIPDSLVKNSAFTIINKIFPFVEYYSCTEKEKEALRRKIQYDGMTVGRIGYIVDFMGGNGFQSYFKGTLIRAEGLEEDNHYINALYEELAKGVYI